jgi:hypothetical protein
MVSGSSDAIDEALAGHCDLVLIEPQPDGSVSVEDNGRGIPVICTRKEGMPRQRSRPNCTLVVSSRTPVKRLQGFRRPARCGRVRGERFVQIG